MEITHGKGKLYRVANAPEAVSAVEYKLYEDLDSNPVRWWGEFYLDTNKRIIEDKRYVIRLEDDRWGRCVVKRLSNRVLIGIPSRHMYRFSGMGPLADTPEGTGS